MNKPTLSTCAEQTRLYAYDLYLATLFAKPEQREATFALWAARAEIERIPAVTSEPMLALIRLTWWREALDEIYENRPVRKHPVAEALQAAIHAHHLPRPVFEAMLDAYEQRFDGGEDAPESPGVEYLQRTTGGWFRLAGLVAGLEGEHLAQAERAGVLWAMQEQNNGGVDQIPHEFLQPATPRMAPAIFLPYIFSKRMARTAYFGPVRKIARGIFHLLRNRC